MVSPKGDKDSWDAWSCDRPVFGSVLLGRSMERMGAFELRLAGVQLKAHDTTSAIALSYLVLPPFLLLVS